jgi:hypothetical protein
MRDLIERLRESARTDRLLFGRIPAARDADEAADALERLTAVEDRYKAILDCRICRNFDGIQHCKSVLRCRDGSGYQRAGTVRLWEVDESKP